jgi:hypothetical protein
VRIVIPLRKCAYLTLESWENLEFYVLDTIGLTEICPMCAN